MSTMDLPADPRLNPSNYKVLPIPPVPQINGCETWRVPPLDGTLSIPQMFDWNAKHNSNHPLFEYGEEDGTARTILWPEAVRAIHRAGWNFRSCLSDQTQPDGKASVIGILASSDSITYFTMICGILRAGYTCLPISVRNSPVAIAHLLAKTKAVHMVVGREHSLRDLSAEAIKVYQETYCIPPTTSSAPLFEDLYLPESEEFTPLEEYKTDWDRIVVIMHSSGSTNLPKPIPWTLFRLNLFSLAWFFGEHNLSGKKFSMHSANFSHAMGAGQICWVPTVGHILTVFRPRSPAIAATPENVLQEVDRSKCYLVYCVSSFVEAWAANPAAVEILQRTTGLIYGGAALAKQVGDFMVSKGINVFNLYGATEAGLITTLIPKSVDEDWEYFTISTNAKAHIEVDADGIGELVVLPNPYQIPNLLNVIVEGKGGYATSDLVIRHPSRPGYWKVLGRKDDQIMHSTGEKTNPGPLEQILTQDPHVRSCIMFGRGKLYPGILVEPESEYKFDPADEEKLAAYRNLIWPTIEKMNDFAPQHSRIFKEMIMVPKPDKPFTYTGKLTPRRQAVTSDYEREIDGLYLTVAETTQAEGITPPASWDLENTKDFVGTVISKVMRHPAENDEDDIFQIGCDSLQATWIRNSIIHALRESAHLETGKLASAESVEGGGDAQRKATAMLSMVAKYGAHFPQHKAGSISAATTNSHPANGVNQDVILLSGTTGGLGSSLLDKLVKDPNVARVYAVNRPRPDSAPLLERQKAALVARGHDSSTVESPKVVLIEAGMSQANLGMSAAQYDEIRATVTHIIHNAYPVNFNLALSSFEPSIKAVRGLIDLALTSPHGEPPRLLFVSSVAVLGTHDHTKRIPEEPVNVNSALANGYSQSKWVVERLLLVTARETVLRPITVRVGQVSGALSGAWNTAEWVPAMVRSSFYLECMPSLYKHITWIPADAVTQAIVEMRNSEHPVLHLAHPRPVQWMTIMEPLGQALNLPFVPYDEWVRRLVASGEGLTADSEVDMMRQNPALILREFFESAIGRDTIESTEALGLPLLDVTKAQKVAPCLSDERLPQLSASDALAWLSYWEEQWALPGKRKHGDSDKGVGRSARRSCGLVCQY